MIDTHAHLSFQDYEKDLDKVINRAIKNGVDKIICVSSNVSESKKAISLSESYPGTVFPAVGIHPQQTDPDNTDPLEKQIDQLEKLMAKNKLTAVGECGLDYSPAPPPEKDRSRKDQLFLFESQIELALKYDLPIIVHSRQAFADTVAVLEKYQSKKEGLSGVIHCYSAGKKGIEKVKNLNFLFGVNGNLTYDQGLQNVFGQIPLKQTLLETDCPFLTPEPFRGKLNEPAHLPYIAQKLAEIKEVDVAAVDQATSRNTKRLFRL